VDRLTEEAFRELLDDRGLLRSGALAEPERSRSYAVFAQSPLVRLDVEGLKHKASQFFQTKIGLTVDKHYGAESPLRDAARVVIASDDPSTSGTRLVYGRAVDPADLAAAEEAERAIGTYGLALLAQRCKTLWLIATEADDDRVALVLAAILASAFLGPILSPSGQEILGVRSARLKLEGRASPYR
jgi:hypothetical protein